MKSESIRDFIINSISVLDIFANSYNSLLVNYYNKKVIYIFFLNRTNFLGYPIATFQIIYAIATKMHFEPVYFLIRIDANQQLI